MTPFDPLDPEEAEAIYDLAVRTGMIVEDDAA